MANTTLLLATALLGVVACVLAGHQEHTGYEVSAGGGGHGGGHGGGGGGGGNYGGGGGGGGGHGSGGGGEGGHGGGGGGGGGHGGGHEGWGWSHPKYKYSYGVKDSHTHDQKEASEYRDGDTVKGHYSLLEPDGSWRTVTYVSDKGGFRAHVHRTPNHHHGGWKA